MIETTLAVVVSILPLLIGDTSLALIILSSAMISAPSSCFVICTGNIGVLLSSSLLGFLLYILQIILNLNMVWTIVLVFVASLFQSLIYSISYRMNKVEEASELLVSLFILISVGLMIAVPEAGSEALYGIASSIWTVTPEASVVFAIFASSIVILTSLLRDSLVSSIFDREFVSVMGSNVFLRYFIMFSISSLGIIITTLTIGLFGAQIVLTLPTLASLYVLRSDVSEILPLNFVIVTATLTLGAYMSLIYNVSALGVASLVMVILTVLLKILSSIARRP